MTSIALHFSHGATANFLVAGIPAAARAAHQVALAAAEGQRVDGCVIAVPGGWEPSRWCEAELARLAPDLAVRCVDGAEFDGAGDWLHLDGEALLPGSAIAELLRRPRGGMAPAAVVARSCPTDALDRLRRAGGAIIAGTGKPGDGIVSRHVNRPVSRLISRTLLRFPGVRPGHATLAAALLGMAMALCLLLGGERGMLFGAVLFQLASIVDGVDGELSRATFRSSRTGAMLDSLTDAVTNLSFFAGLTVNLWLRGQDGPAAAGATGLVLLFTGLLLIGWQSLAARQPFSFDAVKDHFGLRPSRLKQWLTWLTMRDFYAAAAAVCVIAGFTAPMLVLFATVAAAWLAISVAVLAGSRSSSRMARACKGHDRDRVAPNLGAI